MTTRLGPAPRSSRRPPRRPRRRGIASLLAMLYLLLFSVLAIGFYSSINTSVQTSHNEALLHKTFLAAESGVDFMRYHMANLNLPYGTNETNLLGNAAASLAHNLDDTPNMGGKDVAVTGGAIHIPSQTNYISADPTAKTGFRATVTQVAGTRTLVVCVYGGGAGSDINRGIQISYRPESTSYALAGLNGVEMSAGAYTDSYDSTKGAYDPATAGKKGSLVSNGDIKVSGTVKINGDARPGFGKTLTLEDDAEVTGRKTPMPGSVSFPSVTLPATYTNLGSFSTTTGTRNLPGGTYVLDDLYLGGDAVINWTGPVVLYVRRSYAVSGNVRINTYQNLPKNRILYFLPTCTTATWSGSNVCVGELYAPDTDFVISGSVQKLGRITARSIKNSSTGGMHSDDSLPVPTGGGHYLPIPGSYTELH